mmetsp:Transcript_14487/g.14102  ORF Transcript_14487/g.14102 Transcript_14487/m.14102 type:complete len:92 (-) Transcript_14487:929-1204(-)
MQKPNAPPAKTPDYGANFAPNIKKVGPTVAKAPAGGNNKEEKKRNYDKPWLAPEKEKKDPQTFLEFLYPDGIGPDADLIQMLERDVLDKNP